MHTQEDESVRRLPITSFPFTETPHNPKILQRINDAMDIIEEATPLPSDVTQLIANLNYEKKPERTIITPGHLIQIEWNGLSTSTKEKEEGFYRQLRWISVFFKALNYLGPEYVDYFFNMAASAHSLWQGRAVIMYFINRAILVPENDKSFERIIVALIHIIDNHFLKEYSEDEITLSDDAMYANTGNPFYVIDGKDLTYEGRFLTSRRL